MINRPIRYRINRMTEWNDVAAIDERSPRLTGAVDLTVVADPEEGDRKIADPPKKAR